MIFNKYSISSKRAKVVSRPTYVSSYGSNNFTTQSSSINRMLWGNQDNGINDIDENMLVQGNSYIVDFDSTGYDDIQESDNSAIEVEDNGDVDMFEKYRHIFGDIGGNLYVKNKILVDGSIETPEIYASKTLYIPHPTTKVKTDIVELLKGYDTRITTNANNITNLTTRVGGAETNITNIWKAIDELKQKECTCDHAAMEQLKKDVEELKKEVEDLKNNAGSGSGGGETTTKHKLTVIVNEGVVSIVLSGGVSDTVFLGTKTYEVDENKSVSYTATCQSGYTFGSGTASTRTTTRTGSVQMNVDRTITPIPVLWTGGGGSQHLCPNCNSTLTAQECRDKYGTDSDTLRQYPHLATGETIE